MGEMCSHMFKTIYLMVWILVATAAYVSAFSGDAYSSPMVFFTLAILGLLHALALYSLLVNPRMPQQKGDNNESLE